MAGMNFDLLRQGLEALERLGMQAAQNVPAAASGNTAASAPDVAQPAAADAPAVAPAAPTQPDAPQKPDPAKQSNIADTKIPSVHSKPIADARQLRRAIILSEILAPALALRRR